MTDRLPHRTDILDLFSGDESLAWWLDESVLRISVPLRPLLNSNNFRILQMFRMAPDPRRSDEPDRILAGKRLEVSSFRLHRAATKRLVLILDDAQLAS